MPRTASSRAGSHEAYESYAHTVNERAPLTVLDLLQIVPHDEPIPIEEVEAEEHVLWRFMAPGMSEGALSEPAHRAVARAMNVLHRYCLKKFKQAGVKVPPGVGPDRQLAARAASTRRASAGRTATAASSTRAPASR